MDKQHTYTSTLSWTGNTGSGTQNYRSYERSYNISINGKTTLQGSADAAFRGDATKHNPEDMLLAAISSCHMLWFLHFCADAGVTVVSYTDTATALMVEQASGSGYFTQATLKPHVVVTNPAMLPLLNELHKMAGAHCFIANSVKFPVYHEATGSAVNV